MNNYKKYGLLLALSYSLIACKKEQSPSVYQGYDYFPANLGHYVIYECDSVYYNGLRKAGHWDTLKYQVKEVIDSIYTDNQGRPTLRLARYMRFDTTLPWGNVLTPVKLWYGNLLSGSAQRVEDNYRYIKLIFPVSAGATWNGNALNTLGTWNYQYTSVNTPLNVGSSHFDSSLTVLQVDSATFFHYKYYEEQYATGIGLVYKKIIDYSDSLFISIPPPADSANSGTAIYTETYIGSGN